jgi:DNA-binding Lrp family transcriptional regulator
MESDRGAWSGERGQELLSELLSSKVRAGVLGFMVAREEDRFSLTELSRALGISISSVQHECYKLERLGVLKGRREGASRRYWLDRETPFVPVLMWLVVSVIGQEQVLRFALADIEGLEGALLTTSSSTSPKPSVTLIGEVGLEAFPTVQERVGKILEVPSSDVDVAFYGSGAWQQHLASGDSVVERIRSANPVVLVGDAKTLLKG